MKMTVGYDGSVDQTVSRVCAKLQNFISRLKEIKRNRQSMVMQNENFMGKFFLLI